MWISKFAASIGCVAVLASSVALADNNIVTNGDFSSNGAGWTLIHALGGSDFFFGNDPQGNPSAAFGAVGSYDDEVYQTLNTVAGQTYTISFNLQGSGNPNDFSAVFAGNNLLGLSNISQGPTDYSFTSTASGNATVLAFFGRNVPAWSYLTNVSVTAVPEPETYALLALGLGVAGFAARRKLQAV